MLDHWFLVMILLCLALKAQGNAHLRTNYAPQDHKRRLQINITTLVAPFAGVYRNRSRTNNYGFERTVLLSTISYVSLSEAYFRERVINWMCTADRLRLKSVMMVHSTNNNDLNNITDSFLRYWSHQFPESVSFIPFSSGSSRMDAAHFKYVSVDTEDGQVPVSKILSILEVQSLGFDVIYVDINTLILQDFFPLWRRSWIPSVDIIVSLNQTACEYRSLDPTFNLKQEQATISVSFFRAVPTVQTFMRTWLSQATGRHRHKGAAAAAAPTTSINVLRVLESFNSTASLQCTHGARDNMTDEYLLPESHALTYCVMDEFVVDTLSRIVACDYQNPRLFKGLAKAFRFFEPGGLSPTAYGSFVLTVASNAPHPSAADLPWIQHQMWYVSQDVAQSASNFVYTRIQCRDLQVNYTLINNSVWLEHRGMTDAKNALFLRHKQAAPVRIGNQATIYILDRGRLRPVPSADVFLKLGYSWKHMSSIFTWDYEMLTVGPDVSATSVYPRTHHSTPSATMLQPKNSNNEKILGRSREWTELANKSHDPARNEHVKTKLLRAAGVYKNKDKSKALGIEKTVLVSVLGPNSQGSASRYVQLIKNWFCYCSANGYLPVTYLVPAANESQSMEQEFKSWGVTSDVELMTYPVELFWRLLARKNTPLYGNRMSYDGKIPSFDAHGALVMLVPLLEVLEQGFNVIYLDLDTAWLRDPVPFMTKGTADFNVQLEMRSCSYPSSKLFLHTVQWERFEPNTGILHVRSTPKSIAFYRDWMSRIVSANIANDQKVLEFPKMGARISFSCNEYLAHLDHNQTFQSTLTVRNSSAPTYCFFNEMLVQNGKVSLGCAKGMGGSRSEYILEMYEQGSRVGSDESSVLVPASERDLQHPKNQTIVPLMVHMNYCDHKINEMKGLGVWIEEEDVSGRSFCKPFFISETLPGSLSWVKEVPAAVKDLSDAEAKFREGQLVQLHRQRYSNVVMNGTLRRIPDADTLHAMGFTHKSINYMGIYSFTSKYSFGEDMPRLHPNGSLNLE